MSDSMMVHHNVEPHPDTSVPDPHQDIFSKNVLGFWVYLMTDCIIFATLFMTYALFHHQTFGGPTSKEIFSLPGAFIETLILLFSSVTCGLGVLAAVRNEKSKVICWFALTFILGLSFVFLELKEFHHMVLEGNSWKRSAFLSSFFTLVGTHGLHVSFGLLWMLVMMIQVYIYDVSIMTFRRLAIFSLFWHFLDLIWIFIFTLVYLFGVI